MIQHKTYGPALLSACLPALIGSPTSVGLLQLMPYNNVYNKAAVRTAMEMIAAHCEGKVPAETRGALVCRAGSAYGLSNSTDYKKALTAVG